MAWPSTLVRTKNWGTEILTDADLEGQLDLIITYVSDMMHATTGHKHTGTANDGTLINLNGASIGVTGELQETDGGTGLSAYTLGDILYASASNTLSVLAKSTTSEHYLSNQGTSNIPSWKKINLAAGVEIASEAQGDILYRGASAWSRLGAGTSGQFLKTLGAGANPAWADLTAPSSAQLFTTVGSNSWTCPSGVTSILITAIGGGGGGGSGKGGGGGDRGASGGAGGGWCKRYPVAVTPGNTYTVTVGAKGTGGVQPAGNGTAGGNTTFNADGGTLTCAGGAAGLTNSSVSTTGGSFTGTISAAGRLLRPQFITDESMTTTGGASGSGGSGGNGGNGISSSPTTATGSSGGAGQLVDGGAGGGGGGSPWGAGGDGADTGGSGITAASGYGAGGGGSDDNSATNGADGSQGFLLIEW